jgi:hypothetical protein
MLLAFSVCQSIIRSDVQRIAKDGSCCKMFNIMETWVCCSLIQVRSMEYEEYPRFLKTQASFLPISNKTPSANEANCLDGSI